MTKGNKVPQTSGSKTPKASPYSLKSFHSKIMKDSRNKKQQKASKKEFQDAKCSVCMEYPHNAVLLLCSSYHKGCRPYMCATSYRYSNCLDQFKKAYTKVKTIDDPNVSLGSNELLCPLCRGQVKGWTVVKRARKYLNSKKRSCSMQDNCLFVGSYKNLRKHVREDHPLARPREVDPSLAEKWKKLENDRELNDVMSTISSTMPGSIIMGDYVIERNHRGYARDYERDNFIMRIGSRNSRRNFSFRELDYQSFSDDFEIESDDDGSDGISIEEHVRSYLPHNRQGRNVFGGSRRWL